jgi:hypothetical protein
MNPSASSAEVLILQLYDKMKGPDRMVRVNIWQFRSIVLHQNIKKLYQHV